MHSMIHIPAKFHSSPSQLLIFLFLLPVFSVIPISLFLHHSSPTPPLSPPPPSRFSSLIPSPTPNIDIPVVQPPPLQYTLPPANWVPQTFNNCAPATVSMLLQYFDIHLDQNQTKTALRTNSDDKNVFMTEVSAYLQTVHHLHSKLLVNGNLDTIKSLIANNIPVLVEAWLHPNEDIGHVLILRGYDDTKGILITDDSYFGTNTLYPYQTFDLYQWKPFNREYLPVYRTKQETLVQTIIGSDWDPTAMFENSVKYNQYLTTQNPQDVYAWFNLGTSYYYLGRYSEAKTAFESSRQIGWPARLLWYQYQPIATYNQLGESQKALELVSIGLRGYQAYPELHYQAAVAHHNLNQDRDTRRQLDQALSADPHYQPALDLLESL